MLPETFTPGYLKQLELLKIKSRRAFLGSRQGGHLSLKRGHGIEFSDYRKYELGDHPRYIDWNVYARNERLYIKRSQEEQDLSVLLVLDTSGSMGASHDRGKWECARDITLSLAYVALMQQDTVHLSALGVSHSTAHYGMRALHQISKLVRDIAPGGEIRFAREVQRAASRVRFPGVAIVLSDLLMPREEIEAGFNTLRAKNLDITAIQIQSPRDRDPFEGKTVLVAVDSESGDEVALGVDEQVRRDYSTLLEEHQRWLRAYFIESRINFISVSSADSLSQIMVDNLSSSGLLQ